MLCMRMSRDQKKNLLKFIFVSVFLVLYTYMFLSRTSSLTNENEAVIQERECANEIIVIIVIIIIIIYKNEEK